MEKKDVLSWLANSFGCDYLAASIESGRFPTADDLANLTGSGEPVWARRLGRAEFPLDYEPRSMAIDDSGRRVAVGTKAGTVYLATQSPAGDWNLLSSPDGGYRAGNAVRGLAFLTGQVLAASTGKATVDILSFDDAQGKLNRAEVVKGVAGDTEDPLQRCHSIIRLPDNQTCWCMVLTRTGEIQALMKSKRGGVWRADPTDGLRLEKKQPEEILEQWGAPPLSAERVVDARLFTSPNGVQEIVVMGARGSAMRGPQPFRFVANRPFFFVIEDSLTGTILFLGEVQNPR